ncbi:MAG TPA: hypothetical protein VGK74_01370 [Symbiobacteriaceae bacterium]|jgi:hypothetical protein
MLLQRESQVLVREFNRRLRAALRHAPNYMRVEAGLEVESHVIDVLGCRTSALPEPEQVAEILRGFGSPEEYATAIMSQLPAVARASVGSGVREVSMAAEDLARGTGHVLAAAARNGFHLVATVAGRLWQGACWVWRFLDRLGERLRGPAAETRAWLRTELRAGGRAAGWALASTGRAARWVLASTGRLGRGAWPVLTAGVRLLGRVLRWTLRAALTAALGLLALAAFGVAAFAAWAPDVAGWWVAMLNAVVAQQLADLREHTVAGFDPATQTAFSRVGVAVVGGALVAGLLFSALVAFLVWNGRRRRGSVAG